jgi:hypothetical protein
MCGRRVEKCKEGKYAKRILTDVPVTKIIIR